MSAATDARVVRTWMRPGMVVRRLPTAWRYRAGGPDNRGVVTWVEGCANRLHHGGVLAPARNEAVIRFDVGYTNYTTCFAEWEQVPEPEWTAAERVWATVATYQIPDWYDNDDDRISDPDTWAWAMWVSTLNPDHAERIFGDGDWPTDFQELAEAVARCRDFDRAAAEATFT